MRGAQAAGSCNSQNHDFVEMTQRRTYICLSWLLLRLVEKHSDEVEREGFVICLHADLQLLQRALLLLQAARASRHLHLQHLAESSDVFEVVLKDLVQSCVSEAHADPPIER